METRSTIVRCNYKQSTTLFLSYCDYVRPVAVLGLTLADRDRQNVWDKGNSKNELVHEGERKLRRLLGQH